MSQPIKTKSKTKSAEYQIKTGRIAALAKKAGQLANANRKKGYH